MPDDLAYDHKRPLFLPDGTRYALSAAPQALAQAYAAGKPVLIYVHGRAKGIGEPRKSVQTGIYKALAAQGVSAVGFTWDADDGGYDESRALASAEDFHRFIDALRTFVAATPDPVAARPTLLAHSMGNLLVSELAKEDRLTSIRGTLFRNIVFNAAAVKTKRHHLWLSKVGAAERNYVMINPHDKVLTFAGLLFKPDMLGRDIHSPGVTDAQGFYVDLSALAVNHRYFIPAGQNKQASLRAFFARVLRGDAADLASTASQAQIGGISVSRLNKDAGATPKTDADGSMDDEDND